MSLHPYIYSILCILLQCLWVHMYVNHIDLEGIVFLVSFIPSGFYTVSVSSTLGFPEPWVEEISCLGLSILRFLILCVISDCRSLYLFPSAVGGNFSVDGWALIYECSHFMLPFFFFNIEQKCLVFTLSPWAILFQVLGHLSSVSYILWNGLSIKSHTSWLFP